MELVGKKKLALVALDPNDKIFIIYVVFFAKTDLDIDICLFCRG